LTAAIEPFLESYANSLRATEFTSALLERLRTWYREGATFKGAFRKVLFELFDKFGLIIFDPQNERIKSQLIPVFRKSLTDHASISPLLVERSAELEESYHAQVKIKPINVFYQSEKGRILIEPDESAGFRLKRKRVKFSEEEILSLLNMYPERFSPNVLLRPICQDFIFPTAVYVAGPSEISYFAQVMPLYSVHDIQPPIIYPRASATLLEPQQNNLIEKYQINLQELFLESEIFQQKAVQKAMGVDIDLLFSNSEGKLSEIFDELTSRISRIDKTTADGGERYRVKMIAALGEYKQKTLSAEKRKHEILFRQFEKLRSSLFPENTLQERKFNHWMYENKYGLSLIDTLYEKLEIELFQHQFISIAQ
jgi:bacillithiol biosynthesis cysteine-adding enzyme BshC